MDLFLTAEGIRSLGDGSAEVPDFIAEDHVVINFKEWPIVGPYVGHDGLRRWARETFEPVEGGHFELRGDPIAIAPNVIVARQTVRGRLKETGMELAYEMLTMQCIRDGKLVLSKGFLDEDEAIAEARAWAASNPS